MGNVSKQVCVTALFVLMACGEAPTEEVRVTVEGTSVYVSAMQHGWTVASGRYGTRDGNGHTLVAEAEPDAPLTLTAYCRETGACDAQVTARQGGNTLWSVDVNLHYPRMKTDVPIRRTREDYFFEQPVGFKQSLPGEAAP